MPGGNSSTGYRGSVNLSDYRDVNGGGGYGSSGSNATNPGPRVARFWNCCMEPCRLMKPRRNNDQKTCQCGHGICIDCAVVTLNV
ncbi:hypothetical protein LTR91_021584 [Friedmanniomyces endolithicus]|uniref:Uncharacterized protein n=1 Tax=Friedmanniomyces endolithicus TaxID=329885 RepID=A0AAN6H7S5_9PEZI|nr:hypothetical protein LTR38_006005 [Friedmanniomyces endolithicus]KAK0838174.1 hypothetical protein LTR03_012212 [Friedmanniomyces endolithicus]KAK0930390.1 hypothetical protein LTR29_016777 [Friedmanniomyces endolithicus]KAK0957962.1 hypothetical protein LTR91_021584 [Friedmanniomyces endolithicus]KAK0986026.1 hypothetical protein LTS01_010115 [Friedmanniomyces endolithicus]